MTSIRMRLKLRGIYLYDTSDVGGTVVTSSRNIFSFANASYNKILFDSGFSLNMTYTTDVVEKWIGGNFTATDETLISTERFIFPLIYKPLAIIDGTVRGSTKIALRMFAANDDGAVFLTKLIVSLIKIDENANETVLGTVTQDFKPGPGGWLSTIGTDLSPQVWYAFPYFFDVKNEKIDYNDRLILEIKPYGQTIGITIDHARFYLAAAVDADDQYVDVPIV